MRGLQVTAFEQVTAGPANEQYLRWFFDLAAKSLMGCAALSNRRGIQRRKPPRSFARIGDDHCPH
jgi:hypothetical protein